ncbi:MAG: hypothetical protein IIA89_12615 [Chloroflexi bacterium]|nr:hypothetical protein [Chloroflexota bacterium]
MTNNRRLTTKGIAFFGALTVILLLLHAADEIARGEAARSYEGVSPGGANTFFILVLTLFVFGIGWAWKGRKLGHVIVLVMSPFAFLRFFIHAYSLFGSVSLEGIAAAYTSEAAGAFFVFVYLAIALTSLMALLLSINALVVRKRA